MAKKLGTQLFIVDKFLGLNESADGSTELKMGEARKAENFYITDEYNLKSRPGAALVERIAGNILGFMAGNMAGVQWRLVVFSSNGTITIHVTYTDLNGETQILERSYPYEDGVYPVKIFEYGDSVLVCFKTVGSVLPRYAKLSGADGVLSLEITSSSNLYEPVIITGANPAGGGTSLENINILTNYVRLRYSADGTSAQYVLPSTIKTITKVCVDNEDAGGSYDKESHTYTFPTAPVKGVNNVEFEGTVSDDDLSAARDKFMKMKYSEAYNGSTDTRLFFYGDKTNACYYTGATAFGAGLYIPAGNEIAVDASTSPITGMARHYTRLMVYKPGGTYVINYEPVTLEDGTVIAGFYMRSANRDFGNDMDGQVQTVNNYPRTLSGGSLYEWRHSASYYQDERYAKRVSEKISKTLLSADANKIVTCDHNAEQTYYMFLNDDEGTVIVNRYNLDAWTIYKGEVFKGVQFAGEYNGDMLFCTEDSVYTFDSEKRYDASVTDGGVELQIEAIWESGYMAFGADYLRKYSSTIWLSLLPESCSSVDITASTDRRDNYIVKNAGFNLMDFSAIDFPNFSFAVRNAPKIKRLKLKVKKFVYYKLIFRVADPGARATILGYDQQIRYSSYAK